MTKSKPRAKTKPHEASLRDVIRQTSARQKAEPKRAAAVTAESLIVRSISFTPATDDVLERMLVDLAKDKRRRSSRSAIIRALLKYADRHIDTRALGALIESEAVSGEVVWGKKKAD